MNNNGSVQFDSETVEAIEYLKTKSLASEILSTEPLSASIVLGSGLGPFSDMMKGKIEISYDDIPHMPKCSVEGHPGKLVIGYIETTDEEEDVFKHFRNEQKEHDSPPSNGSVISQKNGPTLVNHLENTEPPRSPTPNRYYCATFAGRVHAYEGISYHEVCFQVKLSAALGCKYFILTNSTGGLQDGMYNGCLFVIKDHVRFLGRTDPLDELRYETTWKAPQISDYWDSQLSDIAIQSAKKIDLDIFSGNYAFASGPSYETPLEIKTGILLGGGVVGMSTVPEVICARAYGMRVLGISMVTNLGAGISKVILTHEEVTENAKLAIPRFISLLRQVVLDLHIHAKTIPYSPKVYGKKLRKVEFDYTDSLDSHVEASVNYILTECSVSPSFQGSISSCFYIVCDKTFISSLENVVTLDITSIPHFPFCSIAGNVGQLHFGFSKQLNQHCFAIRTGNAEGFATQEATYLSLIGYKMGFKRLIMTLQGNLVHEDQKSPFSDVSDVLNFSFHTRPLEFLYRIIEPQTRDIFSEHLLEKQETSHIYMTFPGPSRPSAPEMQMANTLGVSSIGRTSIVPIYTFRFMGMNVSSVFVSEYNDQSPEYISHMYDLAKQADPLVVEKSHRQLQFRPKIVHDRRSLVTFDLIKDGAVYMKSQFGNGIKLPDAAVLNICLDGIDFSQYVVREIPLSEIPNFSTYYHDYDLKAKNLQVLKIGQQYVFYLPNSFESYDPFYIAEYKFFMRLLQEIGVRRVALLTSFRDVSNEDKVSTSPTIYSIKDHINFTGENPLFGRNIPQWGPRFPDATTLYSLTFKSHVPKDTNYKMVNALFTSTNRLFPVEAEQEVAHRMNCQVLGDSGISEAILSVHCDRNDRIHLGMLGCEFDDQSQASRDRVRDLLVDYFQHE